MSIEANKAIARRLVEEVQNQQNISAMDELYATDYVYHAAHGVPPTLEGNKVVTRKTMSGTHQGAFVGMPATGKRMTLEILEILHIDGGKILGYWVFYDRLSLMHQLGVLPLPIQPGA